MIRVEQAVLVAPAVAISLAALLLRPMAAALPLRPMAAALLLQVMARILPWVMARIPLQETARTLLPAAVSGRVMARSLLFLAIISNRVVVLRRYLPSGQ